MRPMEVTSPHTTQSKNKKMQTINVPNKSEIKKMIQEETEKQMKSYLKELIKIRVRLADLERMLEVVRE